jgi:hypothetical protein
MVRSEVVDIADLINGINVREIEAIDILAGVTDHCLDMEEIEIVVIVDDEIREVLDILEIVYKDKIVSKDDEMNLIQDQCLIKETQGPRHILRVLVVDPRPLSMMKLVTTMDILEMF